VDGVAKLRDRSKSGNPRIGNQFNLGGNQGGRAKLENKEKKLEYLREWGRVCF